MEEAGFAPTALAEAEAAVAALDATAEHRWSDHAHGRMRWRLWGEGPPLLLLHGHFGSWTHWFRNIPALAARSRLLVPDLPGFGESDVPDAATTAEQLSLMIGEGLDALLGAGAAYRAAAFSMGCRFAGFLAEAAPHRVERTILFGAGGMDLPQAGTSHLEKLKPSMGRRERLALHRRNLGRIMVSGPQAVDALAVVLQDRNVASTRFRPPFRGRDQSLAAILPRLAVPCDLVWGAEDRYVGEHMQARRDFVAALPGPAAFHLVPGAGHWVPYEAPQASNALMLEGV